MGRYRLGRHMRSWGRADADIGQSLGLGAVPAGGVAAGQGGEVQPISAVTTPSVNDPSPVGRPHVVRAPA
jgi:hypothetical protein